MIGAYHLSDAFVYENPFVKMVRACSRDDVYLLIQRGAKHVRGASQKVCSRKVALK